jgi:hypothetical protein
MKKLVLLLLLSGCMTAPPQDEARMWVESLGPSCESQGFEEWTPAWTSCIRQNYAARAQNPTPIGNSAGEPPVYKHTYCTPVQGDKYNCITF